MKILEVIPLAKGVVYETLTYFTSKDAEAGDVVSIPLRKKIINGIVLSATNIDEDKILLKSAGHSFRKINEVKGKSIFRSEFLRTAEKMRGYCSCSIGTILKT